MSETMEFGNAYNIVPVTIEDKDIVFKFLLNGFFCDEPINASLDLLKENGIEKILKNHTDILLDKGKFKNIQLIRV